MNNKKRLAITIAVSALLIFGLVLNYTACSLGGSLEELEAIADKNNYSPLSDARIKSLKIGYEGYALLVGDFGKPNRNPNNVIPGYFNLPVKTGTTTVLVYFEIEPFQDASVAYKNKEGLFVPLDNVDITFGGNIMFRVTALDGKTMLYYLLKINILEIA